MESLIRQWDGEEVVTRFDRPTGAWIFIAIHSTKLGPSAGGTRMKSYPGPDEALEDALRLASGMTYKFAIAGLPFGGAKTVIATPPQLDEESRKGLILRYGELVKQLGGLFQTGPDVGTSEHDMDLLALTAAPYVHGQTVQAGGAGDTGPATALGVFSAMQATAERLFDDGSLSGKRVAVQGAGSVGGTLIELLLQERASIVFSDVDESRIRLFRDEGGLEFVAPEEVTTVECDIFSPNALGGVLNQASIPNLRCSAIVGGANNQLATAEDGERLRRRNILYAPDYVVNSGGAMFAIYSEVEGWSKAKVEAEIASAVGSAARQIYEMSDDLAISTEEAAQRFARQRLAEG
jgi:leucine dehydrogenase